MDLSVYLFSPASASVTLVPTQLLGSIEGYHSSITSTSLSTGT